jgi:hypothetical protein
VEEQADPVGKKNVSPHRFNDRFMTPQKVSVFVQNGAMENRIVSND